jgi:hypothetical protein
VNAVASADPAAILAHVAARRQRLWEAGFRPIAIETTGKRPLTPAWQQRARCNPPADATEAPRQECLNTGILADGLRIVDLDMDDAVMAGQIRELALTLLDQAPMRFRHNSPRLALPYRAVDGSPTKRALAGRSGCKVEILGHGQQLVAFGVHPSGAPLQWYPEPPGAFTLASLPAVSEDQITKFLQEAAPIIGAGEERRTAAGGTVQPGTETIASLELFRNILDASDLHDTLTALAARLIGGGMSASNAVALLQALMLAAPEGAREAAPGGMPRWDARFADIGRIVATAERKYGGDARALGHVAWRGMQQGVPGATIEEVVTIEARRRGFSDERAAQIVADARTRWLAREDRGGG